MDLANLNAFIAVAEMGSFSQAAERLHLTQPAVSKRLASLESQLNVRLFDRLGREIGLTEAGRALLPRAYQILNVLDDTRRALMTVSALGLLAGLIAAVFVATVGITRPLDRLVMVLHSMLYILRYMGHATCVWELLEMVFCGM